VHTLGKESLTEAEFERLAAYCRNDVDLTYAIWQQIKEGFPVKELKLIDLTVRLFTKPMLTLNTALLNEEFAHEVNRKRDLLDKCCADKSVLASNPQFAALLESLGVMPPMKPSPAAAKKGEIKMTYAFGKSDEGFKALLEHPDEAVRAVCEARLGVKSTINETRAGRFLDVASRGDMPVYLTYYGAHTGRFSGGDKMNLQNMTRGSRLRLAIEAPEGYSLVVADLSQIEARVLASLAGEETLLESFRQADAAEGDTDVYTDMASRVFQRPVTKKDKALRQLGKALVLGCGYGLGWGKFQEMQRVGMLGAPSNVFGPDMLETLGVDFNLFFIKHAPAALKLLPPGWENRKKEHLIHCACSKAIVDMYRQSNPAIVQLWETANRALHYCQEGVPFEFGAAPTVKVGKEKMSLPNGMYMQYSDLQGHKTKQGVEYSKQGRNHREKVYGGLVVENLTQAIARIVMTDAMLQINSRYRVVLTVHDELVCCVPEENAEECFTYMLKCMKTAPVWMPDIPLNADGGYARNYSK
jgi:DNA polymerase